MIRKLYVISKKILSLDNKKKIFYPLRCADKAFISKVKIISEALFYRSYPKFTFDLIVLRFDMVNNIICHHLKRLFNGKYF